MALHTTNELGKVAELCVRKSLLDTGYKCYIPDCDSNQTDLVVELENGSYKRVQIKSVKMNKSKTSIEVKMKKYQYTGRVDVLAIYVRGLDKIAYYPYDNEISVILALTLAKNNQSSKRKWFYAYERFPEFS